MHMEVLKTQCQGMHISSVQEQIWKFTFKPVHEVTSIKQSPVLKGHLIFVLS